MKTINRIASIFVTLLICGMMEVQPAHAVSAEKPVDSVTEHHAGNTKYVCPMDMEPGREYDSPGFCEGGGMELIKKNALLRVAVLIYEGVENIDYAGPMEVFGASGATVFTVAVSKTPVSTIYGPQLQPDYDLEHAPTADILLIPGGGVSTVTHDPKLLEWIRQRAKSSRYVMSVCTGAFILGKAGLLDNIAATATATTLDQLGHSFPKTQVVRDKRFVESGKVITTQGLTAGMDGALHVIERTQGLSRAKTVALYLEYPWKTQGDGAYGALARMRLPDLAGLLPEHVIWEKTADDGDVNQWALRGNISFSGTTNALLDNSVSQAKALGWNVLNSDKLQRSFIRSESGKSWHLTLSLQKGQSSNNYLLAMTIDSKSTPK